MKTTDDQDELFVVVDKNDKVVGHRTRSECHQNKNLIHRAVGVMIFNSKDEALLQKRSLTKDLYPDFYCLSSCGHVDKGESYEQSAKRELREELGIAKDLVLKFFKKIIIPFENESHMFAIFTAKGDGPFKLAPKEVESVEFFSQNKIKKMFKEGKLKLTPDTERTMRELKII